MQKSGDFPYWNEDNYQDALISKPDIVILMLGTNDAKTINWDQTNYIKDYKEMANIFLSLQTKPLLYMMIPPPLYKEM